MRGSHRLPRALLTLPFALAAQAQTIPVTDPAFIRAALVVTTFDRLHADCRKSGGFDDAQTAKLNKWQADNGMHGIRARMPALAEHASLKHQVDKGAAAIVRRMFTENVDPCAAAVSISNLPDAQFARVAPQLVSDLGPPATPEKPPASPGAEPASVPAPAAKSAGETQALLKQIDSFGFDTRPKMGVGDLKLEGLYRDLEGAGTVGVGGAQSVTVYDEYRFGLDGSVERTGSAGSTAEAGDTSVATSMRRAPRRGRYMVDGLTLTIRYDDGSSEQRILIADPKDPGKAIWLDGTGYVKRGK